MVGVDPTSSGVALDFTNSGRWPEAEQVCPNPFKVEAISAPVLGGRGQGKNGQTDPPSGKRCNPLAWPLQRPIPGRSTPGQDAAKCIVCNGKVTCSGHARRSFSEKSRFRAARCSFTEMCFSVPSKRRFTERWHIQPPKIGVVPQSGAEGPPKHSFT